MRTLLWILLLPACVATDVEGEPSKDELATLDDEGKSDGIDWCKVRNWYGDGECDRFCKRHDQDCPLLGAEPRGSRTQFPIVFHHGFAGGHSGVFAWDGVVEALGADGNIVVETQVPPFDGIAVRAASLKRAVDDTLLATGAAKVNIVAHSLGGLDARHLISITGYGDKVASLTTISTPHQGTRAADLGLGLTPGFARPVIDALAGLLGEQINSNALSTNVRAALEDLAVRNAAARNARTPDDPRVFYQSWAGVSSVLGLASERDKVRAVCDGKLQISDGTFDRLRGLFVLVAPVISDFGKDHHDGLVTVASSKWGQFNGCIPADHSDEVGQLTAGAPDPRTSFDHGRFYRQVADGLAARGL